VRLSQQRSYHFNRYRLCLRYDDLGTIEVASIAAIFDRTDLEAHLLCSSADILLSRSLKTNVDDGLLHSRARLVLGGDSIWQSKTDCLEQVVKLTPVVVVVRLDFPFARLGFSYLATRAKTDHS
jgi:hypothetical protein